MLVWLILLLLLAGAVPIILRAGQMPHRRKSISPSETGKYFDALLKDGAAGSLMFIETLGGARDSFLQFAKYVEGGSTGLQFSFPRAPWSSMSYSSVKAALRDHGLRAGAVPPSQEGNVSEFLIIDCGREIQTAVQIAVVASEVLWQIKREDRLLQIYYQGMPPL